MQRTRRRCRQIQRLCRSTPISQSKADAAINEVERLINQEKVDIIDGVYASAHAVPLAAKVGAAEEDPLDHDCGRDSRVQGQEPEIRFPRADPFRSIWPGVCWFHRRECQRPSSASSPSCRKGCAHPRRRSVRCRRRCGRRRVFARKAGLQIVLREGYSAAAPDLSSLVTKLKRAGADVISHVGYNPDITLFLRQARESGLRFKMLIGAGAGYSQLDKLRATFGKDIDNFCNIDPVPAQLLDPAKLAPGIGRAHQDHGRALQGQGQRHRCAAALLDGLQPDLDSAQQRAAGRQREIRRLRRRGGAQGRARRRYCRRAAPFRATA